MGDLEFAAVIFGEATDFNQKCAVEDQEFADCPESIAHGA